MTEPAPITAAEALRRVENGALLVDVRSLAGREASGEIDGARLVAKDAVAEFAESVDPDADIVVFCGTTAGSGPVVDWLDEHGFTGVAHVEGGFGALDEVGLPVRAASSPEA